MAVPNGSAAVTAIATPSAPSSSPPSLLSSSTVGTTSSGGMIQSEDTMLALVSQGLIKLEKASSRRHKELRTEYARVMPILQAEAKRIAQGGAVDNDADKYFLGFKLACEADSAKLRGIALDTMYRMMTYGYLTGNAIADPKIYPAKAKPVKELPKKVAAVLAPSTPTPRVAASAVTPAAPTAPPSSASASASSAATPRRLIEVIIETIHDCSMYEDDGVQLQVIRILLLAVTSVHCQVHDQSLLQAIRACYHIYLMSRSLINQSTAKGALTQMLNIVFQRMEHLAHQLRQLDLHQSQLAAHAKATATTNTNDDTTNGSSSSNDNGTLGDSKDGSNASSVSSSSLPPLPTSSGAAGEGKYGFCVVCRRAANHYCVQTRDPVCGVDCKNINFNNFLNSPELQQILYQQHDDNGSNRTTRIPLPGSIAASGNLRLKIGVKFIQLQKDAYAVFRALCKLSSKPLPEPTEPLALRSKSLSLELILSVLDNAGATFRTAPQFIKLVKDELVMSLLKNSVTPIESIFRLSSSIFVILVAHFKLQLKKEIGSILHNIYLTGCLATPHSTYGHKLMALSVFGKLCADPQTIVDIFINYDCRGSDSFPIFETLTAQLARIAQGAFQGASDNWMSVEQESSLKLVALECLASIMRSLVIWSRRAYDPNSPLTVDSRDIEDDTLLGAVFDPLIAGAGTRGAAAGTAPPTPTPSTPSSTSSGGNSFAAANATNNSSTPLSSSHTRTPSGGSHPSVVSSSSPVVSGNDGSSSNSNRDNDADGTGQSNGNGDDSKAIARAPAGFFSKFSEERSRQIKIDTGILKFNMDPKKGLAYMFEHGLAENTPEGIANFFHMHCGGTATTLDKTEIGEYLGSEKDWNQRVLVAYTEMLDFRALAFDDGIRRFLEGFRIPGEAQKIDRIMQAFAEHYCRHNPTRFETADAAYILAYSVIMLNTDAHSPNVKHRMTKEQFLRNNRKIDNGKDIDQAFMEDLYDRIVHNEIILKDDPFRKEAERADEATLNAKKRIGLFMKETQAMVRRTTDAIRGNGERRALGVVPADALPDSGGKIWRVTKDKPKPKKSELAAQAAAAAAAAEAAAAAAEIANGSTNGTSTVDSAPAAAALSTSTDGTSSSISSPAVLSTSTSSSSMDGSNTNNGGASSMVLSSSTTIAATSDGTEVGTSSTSVTSVASTSNSNGDSSSHDTSATSGTSSTSTSSTEGKARTESLDDVVGTADDDDGDGEDSMSKAESSVNGTDGSVIASSSSTATGTGTNEGKTANDGKDDEEKKRRSEVRARAARERERDIFYEATAGDYEAVQPMFELLHFPALATFSVLLEHSDDHRVITLCLDGYRRAIRISSAFDMDLPRVAYVNSLQGFTLLGGAHREMKPKNIAAIMMLLRIAHTEGNFLKTSWRQVLNCISEFERLQLIGSSDSMDQAALMRSPNTPLQSRSLAPAKGKDAINSQHISNKVEPSLIDRVFTRSMHLNSEAIVFFVECLIETSEAELKSSPPRLFSLQKIVEITYYNMGRIRLVWNRIWSMLSAYFEGAGLHSNEKVSMQVMESLRQLATKFLEKDELSNHQFQKQFLKPFEYVMMHTPSTEIREFIVQSLTHMVQARVNNIKTGWKSVFVVFSCAARDPHHPLVVATFKIVKQIMTQWFSLISDSMDTLAECVNCLVALGCNVYTDISLQAVEHLGRCAQFLGSLSSKPGSVHAPNELAAGKDGGPPSPDMERHSNSGSGDDHISHLSPAGAAGSGSLKVWFSILTGLSRMIGDARLEVRSRSLQQLFKMLHVHGRLFSLSTWQLVFRGVLFPIFDDVRATCRHRRRDGGNGVATIITSLSPPVTLASQAAIAAARDTPPPSPRPGSQAAGELVRSHTPTVFDQNWLETTCYSALSTLIELFSNYHNTVAFMLPELLALINSCIDQDSEYLSGIGTRCWIRLLTETGIRFTSEQWSTVIEYLAEIFQATMPVELLDATLRARLSIANVAPPAGPTTPSTSPLIHQYSSIPYSSPFFAAGAPWPELSAVPMVSASSAPASFAGGTVSQPPSPVMRPLSTAPSRHSPPQTPSNRGASGSISAATPRSPSVSTTSNAPTSGDIVSSPVSQSSSLDVPAGELPSSSSSDSVTIDASSSSTLAVSITAASVATTEGAPLTPSPTPPPSSSPIATAAPVASPSPSPSPPASLPATPAPLISQTSSSSLLPPSSNSGNNITGSPSPAKRLVGVPATPTPPPSSPSPSLPVMPMGPAMVPLPFTSSSIASKCNVQLMMMNAISDVLQHFLASRTYLSARSRAIRASPSYIPAPSLSLPPPEHRRGSGSHDDMTADTTGTSSSRTSNTNVEHKGDEGAELESQLLEKHVISILDCLLSCAMFARTFNNDVALRRRLAACGFTHDDELSNGSGSASGASTAPVVVAAPAKGVSGGRPAKMTSVAPVAVSTPSIQLQRVAPLPDLFYHEAHALDCYVRILLQMYSDEAAADEERAHDAAVIDDHPPSSASSSLVMSEVERRLTTIDIRILTEYVRSSSAVTTLQQQRSAAKPIGRVPAPAPPPSSATPSAATERKGRTVSSSNVTAGVTAPSGSSSGSSAAGGGSGVQFEVKWFKNMDGVCCTVLDGLLRMSSPQFDRHLRAPVGLYASLSDLIQYGSPAIRHRIRSLFAYRLPPLLPFGLPVMPGQPTMFGLPATHNTASTTSSTSSTTPPLASSNSSSSATTVTDAFSLDLAR